MGSHFNEREKRCWSCEFFSGQREIKSVIFLGDSILTSNKGVCICKKSSYYNRSVSDDDRSCSKYQRCGVVESIIVKKQNEQIEREQEIQNERIQRQYQSQKEKEEREFKEKQKRIDRENKAEQERMQKERYALERERQALEMERKKLEYERWYNSLSPDEKEKEDCRVEEEKKRKALEAEEIRLRVEKKEKERKIREEVERKERERQKVIKEAERKERERQKAVEEALAKKKKKRKNLIICCIGVLMLVSCIIGIKSCYNKKNNRLIFEYSYWLGGYEISAGSLYNCSSTLVIPSTYEGKKVVAIKENGFANQTGITELIIPDSIIKIGDGAFNGCKNIISITLPFTGNTAYDTNEFKVIFGKNDSCINNIKNLTFTGTYVKEKAFQNCKFETVYLPNVKYIGNYAFDNNRISKLELSSSLKSIGGYAFQNCSLTTLTIPADVEYIGTGAFFGNDYLSMLTVDLSNSYFCAINNVLYSKDKTVLYCYPGGLSNSTYSLLSSTVEIKASSFSGNKNLKTLISDSCLTTICNYAFYGCNNISSLYLDISVNSLGSKLFNYNSFAVTIYYVGTQEQWDNISFKISSYDTLNGANLVCNYDFTD